MRDKGVRVLTVREILAYGTADHVGARLELEEFAMQAGGGMTGGAREVEEPGAPGLGVGRAAWSARQRQGRPGWPVLRLLPGPGCSRCRLSAASACPPPAAVRCPAGADVQAG